MKCESLQSTTDLYDSVVDSGVGNGFYRLEKLFSELIPVTPSVVDSLSSSAPVAAVFMTSWEKAAVSRHSYKL